MRSAIITLCLCGLLVPLSASAQTSWSYSDYSRGSYVPRSGNFIESAFSGGTATGYTYYSGVEFTFDSTNRSSILDYNNGGNNPGTACDNVQAFVTIDQAAVPDNDETLSARSISTNLPDPKTDLENDSWFNTLEEEAEVVALGTVAASTFYFMDVYWDDYRTGYTSDRGQIQVQFAMSNQGFSDYNNCTQSSAIQIINRYLGCVLCT
jgi:hypothetical protein